MTEPTGKSEQKQAEQSPAGLSPYRTSLMEALAVSSKQPNLVEQTYARVGLTPPPGSTTFDGQVSVGELRPGDLVGWHGGNIGDSYQGNLAVYAGNREIIEPYFQVTRRRRINDDENVFGIPVVMTDETPTGV